MQLNHLFILYIQLIYDAYKVIRHNRMQFNRNAFRCRYPSNLIFFLLHVLSKLIGQLFRRNCRNVTLYIVHEFTCTVVSIAEISFVAGALVTAYRVFARCIIVACVCVPVTFVDICNNVTQCHLLRFTATNAYSNRLDISLNKNNCNLCKQQL